MERTILQRASPGTCRGGNSRCVCAHVPLSHCAFSVMRSTLDAGDQKMAKVHFSPEEVQDVLEKALNNERHMHFRALWVL